MNFHFCVRDATEWSLVSLSVAASRDCELLGVLPERARMLDAWLRTSIWALISAMEDVRSFSAASAARRMGSLFSDAVRGSRSSVRLVVVVDSRDFLIGVERSIGLLDLAAEVGVLRGERKGLERVEVASMRLRFAGVGPDIVIVVCLFSWLSNPAAVVG